MRYAASYLFPLLCWMASVSMPVGASDYFVAPNGTSLGPGTFSQPYSLQAALSGELSQPGDTFWLRRGEYKVGHLETRIQGAPGAPITFRQVPGEQARIDGSLTIFNSNGHLVFRDFELYSSDTNRISASTNAGFEPPDLILYPGIGCYTPEISFINLLIHDQTRHGIYISEYSSNNLIYGCILFNNGWASQDNAEGHGLYIQGMGGMRKIADNVVFNNSGANMHVYENASGQSLVGVHLEGNIAFNAGAIQNTRTYRDWIIGVDQPALYADAIILRNNMGYKSPDAPRHPEFQVGREGINGTVVVADNYMPLPMLFNNWSIAIIQNNLFAASPPNHMVSLNQTIFAPFIIWNFNTYAGFDGQTDFQYNLGGFGFEDWQAYTGFDKESQFREGPLSGTKIFVRPNTYEAGRALIVVYNWDNLEQVTVDLNSILTTGSVYEVRNAQNMLGNPVCRGVHDGQPLTLSLTDMTVTAPNGPLLTAPSTAPTFNVFVLLPGKIQLEIKQSNDSVQISWPTNYGPRTLLRTESLADSNGWSLSTNQPVANGDRFIVTEPAGEPRGKFYRLQI